MRISEEIAKRLRDEIISGVYKPRERLIEAELSKKYNVSRTPIREAIKQLEAAGLIKVEPYHGAVIAEIDAEEIRDIYETRCALEGTAAYLATIRMTPERLVLLEQSLSKLEQYVREKEKVGYTEENERFHQLIYSQCGNKVLLGLINDLLERTATFRHLSFRSTSNIRLTLKDHKNLFHAIKAGDAAKAQALSAEHIRLYLSQEILDQD